MLQIKFCILLELVYIFLINNILIETNYNHIVQILAIE